MRLGSCCHRWLRISYTITYDDGSTVDFRAQVMRHGNIIDRNILMRAGGHAEFRLFLDFHGELTLVLENLANVSARVDLEVSKE